MVPVSRNEILRYLIVDWQNLSSHAHMYVCAGMGHQIGQHGYTSSTVHISLWHISKNMRGSYRKRTLQSSLAQWGDDMSRIDERADKCLYSGLRRHHLLESLPMSGACTKENRGPPRRLELSFTNPDSFSIWRASRLSTRPEIVKWL